MYRDLPPEAALDGRPEGAELLLQRTLRTVRAEKARASRWRGGIAAVVTATLIAATLAGGMYVGQQLGDNQVLVASTVNGPSMSVNVVETDGGVRLVATVEGVPRGEKCWLVVKDRDGQAFVAGSWLASESHSVTLAGAAMVDLANLRSVSVVTADKRELVRAQAENT